MTEASDKKHKNQYHLKFENSTAKSLKCVACDAEFELFGLPAMKNLETFECGICNLEEERHVQFVVQIKGQFDTMPIVINYFNKNTFLLDLC